MRLRLLAGTEQGDAGERSDCACRAGRWRDAKDSMAR